MIVAIVSDTHDNIQNLEKAIRWLNDQGVVAMLHCGDICTQATIESAKSLFKGEITFVRGNGDYDLEEIPETTEMTLDGKRIFFNHYPDVARQAAESGKYDIVFHGHTHRPWLEETGKCKIVNPGELAGQRYKPTFAIYDTETDRLELKMLENI